jgi:hypothetical protein
MKTVLRILGGIALIILGFGMARAGFVALVEGLYVGSPSSVLAGILGLAMMAGGIYLFIKGWQ